MTVYTFNNDFTDLYYELNHFEIFNDIYSIIGVAGSEVLVRGADQAVSIPQYARRTLRMDVPIGASQDILYKVATDTGLIKDALGKYSEPVAMVSITVIGDNDTLIAQLLSLDISDKVTVVCDTMGMNKDFVIESVELAANQALVITARYGLRGLRAGE